MPRPERPVYVCTYMFIDLYTFVIWDIIYVCFSLSEICKVFINELKWISFLEDETFWCAKFFCDPIISHVLKRTQNTWSDAFQVKLQLALCLQGPMRPLFVLENAMVLWWFIYFAFRCTDREVSEQDQQHPQPWFKTNTRWILNHSAGLSTLRHFKSLSRSFNTSTSVAGQLQGQRAFQWSEDFCHCGVPVCFFLINLMSHARQWEHRSGFIGDFYYDVGLLFSSAYGFVLFSVCLHQKRQ